MRKVFLLDCHSCMPNEKEREKADIGCVFAAADADEVSGEFH
jgi:hypothetical protein